MIVFKGPIEDLVEALDKMPKMEISLKGMLFRPALLKHYKLDADGNVSRRDQKVLMVRSALVFKRDSDWPDYAVYDYDEAVAAGFWKPGDAGEKPFESYVLPSDDD